MRILNTVMRWLLGILLIAAGINHFWHSAFYLNIMPDYLPWHTELVYASGVCEVVLGAMLLVPRSMRLAAWGVVAMLLVFLSVHIHMIVHAERYATISPLFLWFRLLLQLPLIAWAYWLARSRDPVKGVKP